MVSIFEYGEVCHLGKTEEETLLYRATVALVGPDFELL
jgi:hypothetical protein